MGQKGGGEDERWKGAPPLMRCLSNLTAAKTYERPHLSEPSRRLLSLGPLTGKLKYELSPHARQHTLKPTTDSSASTAWEAPLPLLKPTLLSCFFEIRCSLTTVRQTSSTTMCHIIRTTYLHGLTVDEVERCRHARRCGPSWWGASGRGERRAGPPFRSLFCEAQRCVESVPQLF